MLRMLKSDFLSLEKFTSGAFFMIAIYARQSIEKEDSISTGTQIDFCSYEARGEKYLVYEDKGFSGKNTNRPRLQALISDISNGGKGITKVVVYRLDRISRSILDFSEMMKMFEKYSVEFVSATEKFDTSTPMGRAMLNICIVFAQLERETIQQRVCDAYVSRSQKGFFMGGTPPLGFCKVKTTIDNIQTSMYAPVEEELNAVRMAFEMYANVNYSNEDIAKKIRELPEKMRQGRTVTRARIQDLIKNPAYVKADFCVYNFYKERGAKIINPPEDFVGINGCYLYTGTGKARKQIDLSNAVLVLAPHEGVIGSDLWLRCRQRALSQQQIKRNPKAKNTYLAGLVKCGRCGYALVRKNYKSPKNNSYFFCSRKMNDGLCEGCGTIYADEFETLIFHKIINRLAPFQTFDAKNEQDNKKMDKYNLKLLQVDEKINSIIENMSGANNVVMDYVNYEIERLHIERQNLLLGLKKIEKSNINKKNINCDFNKLDDLPFELKRELAYSLIEKIYASKEQIDIIWKI